MYSISIAANSNKFTMSRIYMLTFCAVLFGGALSSCKKGEDDPFLSLRSRKARLAGVWTLKGRIVEHRSNNNTTVATSTYANGREDKTEVDYFMSEPTDTTFTSRLYTQIYTFKKNGSYQKVAVSELGTSTEKGVWSFLQRNKGDGLKNKEAILLTPRVFQATPGYEVSYTGSLGQSVYLLTQLRNQKMVWSVSSSELYANTSTMTDVTLTFG